MEIKELKTKVKIVFPEESEIFMAEEFLSEVQKTDLSEKPVELDFSAVKSIDTVFIQLALSIIKTIHTRGNRAVIKSSEAVGEALAVYGIQLAESAGGEE